MEAESNRIYNLLSDILKIPGQYNNKEIEKAVCYIKQTSRGEYRDIMSSILKNFNELSNIAEFDSAENQKANISTVKKTADKPSKNRLSAKDDSRVRELTAMMRDTEFVNSKQDVVTIADLYFKDRIVFRSDNKDSRKSLTGKLIGEFRKMDTIQQKNIYSSIRRLYLKNRKSNLSEWADIITDGES